MKVSSEQKKLDLGKQRKDGNDHGYVPFSYLPPKGEWIKDPNKTFAAPVCCSYDKNQFLKNPESCGTFSQRNSHHELRGRRDYLAQTGSGGCFCGSRGFKDEYTWTGLTAKWDAHKTCHKLANRTVLLIGDSTMLQTAATLMNAMHPAGCQTQFISSISDTLVGRPLGRENRGDNWTNLVFEFNPDIVILTAGAHIYNRSNFDFVITNVIQEAAHLKAEMPNLELAWKTQQPGGCTTNVAQEIELSPKQYQYDQFYERDLYALSELPRHGIHVIDMRMLYYRSDAHPGTPDCLHMCVPGPLDIIAPLFSQLLDQL